MKTKLTLLASAVLALSLAFTSSANANSHQQRNNHNQGNHHSQESRHNQVDHQNHRSSNVQQFHKKQVIYKKVVQRVQKNKHYNKKNNTQHKPSTTIIKIETTHSPLLSLLFSQSNFNGHSHR